MIIVQVTFEVKPDRVADFRAATVDLVRHTRQECGCERAEFYQLRDDPSMFMLFEMYRDEAALASHMQSAPFQHWRQATLSMFSGPGYGEQYFPIEPPHEELLSAD